MLKKISLFIFTMAFAVASHNIFARKGDVFSQDEIVMAKHSETDSWIKAKILIRNDDQYKIHYHGTSNDDDIWVTVYQLEKLANFGKDYKTSEKNTRKYKLASEIEYFCKKKAVHKNIRGMASLQFVQQCRDTKHSQTSTKIPLPIIRFNPDRPQDYEIHQACIGYSNKW